jgi:hypothetical protein
VRRPLLDRVTITPAAIAVAAGGQSQLSANCYLGESNAQPFACPAASTNWSSADLLIATVNPTGQVTGVRPGMTRIKARVQLYVGEAKEGA